MMRPQEAKHCSDMMSKTNTTCELFSKKQNMRIKFFYYFTIGEYGSFQSILFAHGSMELPFIYVIRHSETSMGNVQQPVATPRAMLGSTPEGIGSAASCALLLPECVEDSTPSSPPTPPRSGKELSSGLICVRWASSTASVMEGRLRLCVTSGCQGIVV
jgi:hypothetical protein